MDKHILLNTLFSSKFWYKEFKKHHFAHISFISFIIGYLSYGLILSSGLIIIWLNNIFDVSGVLNFSLISGVLIMLCMLYAYISADLDTFISNIKLEKQTKVNEDATRSE